MMRSHLCLLVLLGLASTACVPRAMPASPAASLVAASTLPSPTPSPAPTVVPSPTPPGCLDNPGSFQSFEITDDSLSRPLAGLIYLPPCFDPDRPRPYPVLFLFHGLASDEHQWQTLGIGAHADSLIRQGARVPFLIVLPAERKGIDLGTSFTDVLLPFVQDHYDAAPARSQRSIGGLSRGAGWALRIGMTNPHLFSRIGMHSPAVLPPDMLYLPAWIEGLSPEQRPLVSIDIGDRDTLLPDANLLEASLRDLGMDVVLQVSPGYHDAAYWSSHISDYLDWYTAAWVEAR